MLDELTISITPGTGITVNCHESPGKDNLAWKAADQFLRFVCQNRHIEIDIHKNIPSGAGLGGGSSDAACVIKALNQMLGCGLDRKTLKKIGEKVGSDVPCFMHDRWRRMQGRGEIVDDMEGPVIPIVLVIPDTPVSTPFAYKEFDRTCSFSVPKNNRLDQPFNDLLKPALSIAPEISNVLKTLEQSGANPATMTGSGCGCFGVYKTKKQADQACLQISGKYRCFSLSAGS
jgi:4-diphosphocytidyl-2-C-methyl-D-erythritol kinase